MMFGLNNILRFKLITSTEAHDLNSQLDKFSKTPNIRIEPSTVKFSTARRYDYGVNYSVLIGYYQFEDEESAK